MNQNIPNGGQGEVNMSVHHGGQQNEGDVNLGQSNNNGIMNSQHGIIGPERKNTQLEAIDDDQMIADLLDGK